MQDPYEGWISFCFPRLSDKRFFSHFLPPPETISPELMAAASSRLFLPALSHTDRNLGIVNMEIVTHCTIRTNLPVLRICLIGLWPKKIGTECKKMYGISN